MNFITGFVSLYLLMAFVSFGHAQPAPSSAQSAKEQRQSKDSKDKARPDRSKAEEKKIKGAQKEAQESHDRKMNQANTELQMGVASGTGKMGATSSGKKQNEKLDARKDAPKKPVQQPLSGR